MFEGHSADTRARKFSLASMGVRAEGLVCADPGARTPIGDISLIFSLPLKRDQWAAIVFYSNQHFSPFLGPYASCLLCLHPSGASLAPGRGCVDFFLTDIISDTPAFYSRLEENLSNQRIWRTKPKKKIYMGFGGQMGKKEDLEDKIVNWRTQLCNVHYDWYQSHVSRLNVTPTIISPTFSKFRIFLKLPPFSTQNQPNNPTVTTRPSSGTSPKLPYFTILVKPKCVHQKSKVRQATILVRAALCRRCPPTVGHYWSTILVRAALCRRCLTAVGHYFWY